MELTFKNIFFYLIGCALIVTGRTAHAQVPESLPQEAPYVEEDEFAAPDAELTESESKKKKSQKTELENEILAEIPDDAPETLTPPEDTEKVHSKKAVAPPASEIKSADEFVEPQLEVTEKNPEWQSAPPSKAGRGFIHHPLSAKGLLAITKDGAYVYETNESRDYHQTGTLRFATMDPPHINAADGTSYSNMYGGGTQSILIFDYEWQPFTRYGKLGLQSGIGFLYANGQGRFDTADPVLKSQEAKEKYTFLAVPISFGAVYRLEWLKRQWFAPYASAGLNYFPVIEFRDDGHSPNAVGTAGAYGAGGVMLNVSAVDRETAFILTSEYGISNLWVSLEYRIIQTFNPDLDFSSDVLSAGIAVDY